jgi:hypothetical protein
LDRHNGTVLDSLSLLNGPANRGVIDGMIGSLSSLRKQYDEPLDHICLAHPSDESLPVSFETLELINN